MKLTEKQLKKLKTKLALNGTGAKKRLAELLNCEPSQLTYVIKTGECPERFDKTIKSYIK